MFILDDQRVADVAGAFRRYQDYLESERHRFPSGALALATSEWYFDFNDHRCPHDAWLQRLTVQETGLGDRQESRSTSVFVQLLGAYHDLVLTFNYRGVYRYSFDGSDVGAGHTDWRYDEFRLAESGRLVHEIEWCSSSATGRWLIEAEDVSLEFSAMARGA
jgi:hypothetical protein